MTPLDWVKKLSTALDERAKKVEKNEAWYSGDHPLPSPPENTFAAYDTDARMAFQAMCRMGITNLLAPVVDQPASKLGVQGFRFGDSNAASDGDAWAIWQRNYLDADQDLAHTAGLKTGQAFLLVWADDDDDSDSGGPQATITVEDPSQAIVCYEAGSRRERAAGLKRWLDDSGYMFATLYLPDGIYKFRSTRSVDSKLVTTVELPPWEPRLVGSEPWPVPNPLEVVPLIEMRFNAPLKPSMCGGGIAEFAGVINDQRRTNQTIMNMLVTQEHQAFRQRWVTGWGAPTDENGQVDQAQVKKASASALWIFEDENVKVGDFQQAEFRPFVDVINLNARLIAANSSTPPRAFLLGDLINVAKEAIASIDSTFTAKVVRHSRQAGEAWEEAIRLALKIEGNDKWKDTQSSVVWGDVFDRTASEQLELAIGMKQLGVPDEVVWTTLPGVTQQDAQRWAIQATTKALMLPAPAATAVTPAPVQGEMHPPAT